MEFEPKEDKKAPLYLQHLPRIESFNSKGEAITKLIKTLKEIIEKKIKSPKQKSGGKEL